MKTRFIFLFVVLFCIVPFLRAQSLADRIGVCASVNKAPLLKQAGCSYVEIGIRSFLVPDKPDSIFEANLQAAKDAVLPLYSGNSFFPGDLRLTGPDVCLDKIMEYGEVAIRRAREAGIKVLVLGSGSARNIPDGFSREEATGQFTALCRRLARYAAGYDVCIAIEPLQSSETNFINTVREGTAIAEKVNHPNLGVLADFFHMLRENEDAEALVDAGKWLKHCHIAEKEIRSAPGVKGDDFTPFFKALHRVGYTGSLSIECKWENMDDQLAASVASIKEQIYKSY